MPFGKRHCKQHNGDSVCNVAFVDKVHVTAPTLLLNNAGTCYSTLYILSQLYDGKTCVYMGSDGY